MTAEFSALVSSISTRCSKLYPKFLAYLTFDLTTSLILFWIANKYPSLYDIPWRTIQGLLVIGRIALVMEAYKSMVPTKRFWRASDSLICVIAALGTLVFHASMVRPLRWPGSTLELVLSLIGASHTLLGFVMIGLLASKHELSGLARTHARLLATYFLLTAPCYYLFAMKKTTNVSLILMLVATICYSLWASLAIYTRVRKLA